MLEAWRPEPMCFWRGSFKSSAEQVPHASQVLLEHGGYHMADLANV
jgi:hypothetical protein